MEIRRNPNRLAQIAQTITKLPGSLFLQYIDKKMLLACCTMRAYFHLFESETISESGLSRFKGRVILIKLNKKLAIIGSTLVAALVGCGGFVYTTVGGSVKGLTTDGKSTLVLVNDASYSQTLSADGNFSFKIASNAAYNISIHTQPNPVNCTIANGSGKMTSETPVTNISVNCVPNVPLSGVLTGLNDTKTLQLAVNDIQQTAITANGAFNLQTYIVNQKAYAVKVSIPPASQVCTVLNGTGTANVNDVSAAKNIAIDCVAGVPVGGTLAGLKVGTVLGLTSNGTDVRTLLADGVFTFNFSLLDGAAYDVQVSTQPTGQKCTVTNGAGRVNAAAPDASQKISVSCVAA
ncbi:hypothetical protein [Undibacterium sp. Di24W]|uniref:hypothetical protein n=1 Tax=Undibacterium sp. Di24W TaxID=3413033 RepID=UPI003BF3B388